MTFPAPNSVLSDGTSVYTAGEWTTLKQLLKKAYDYARDNLLGSTP